MKWTTLRAIELTWPGVPVTAWASIRPSRSKTPAEMSPASRAAVEKAVRTSVARLLLDDREQAVPHHLQADIVSEVRSKVRPVRWHRCSCQSSRTIWPRALTRAVKPCGTTVVVLVLDDQRRPVEPMPGRKRLAVIEGGRLAIVPVAGSKTSRAAERRRRRHRLAARATGCGSGRSVASDRVQVSASTSSRGMVRPNRPA